MGRGVVVLALVAVALGGCRVKKERIRGKTRVDIQGESVQITTDTARVRIGSESARVPVPRVHVGTTTSQ